MVLRSGCSQTSEISGRACTVPPSITPCCRMLGGSQALYTSKSPPSHLNFCLASLTPTCFLCLTLHERRLVFTSRCTAPNLIFLIDHFLSFSSLVGDDDAFPYANLSTEDLQRIQFNSLQALKRRRKSRRSRSMSPSPAPGRSTPRTRARARRLRSPSPAMSLAAVSRRSAPNAPPQAVRSVQPRWSIMSLFAPGLPLLLMSIFISLALIAVAMLLLPITRSFQKIVDTITSLNPVSALSALLGPTAAAIGSLPLGAVYCGSIGIGCPEKDRQKAFRTAKFADHPTTEPNQQVSLGGTFFDCLNDLRITRHHEFAVAQ